MRHLDTLGILAWLAAGVAFAVDGKATTAALLFIAAGIWRISALMARQP